MKTHVRYMLFKHFSTLPNSMHIYTLQVTFNFYDNSCITTIYILHLFIIYTFVTYVLTPNTYECR
jgi:hypothetical protein